jgi:uncharacterized protein YkwD
MSRSVTKTVSVIGAPLLALAVASVIGALPHPVTVKPIPQRNVSALRLHPLVPRDTLRHIATEPTITLVAALHASAPPTHPAARAAGPVRAPKRPLPPVSAVGGAAGVEFSLVNQDRAANGEPPLAWSGSLARVAQYRAQDMLNRNYFSHYDPSTGQLAFVELLHLWGIPYSSAAENIAWSTNPSMAAINTMFMNSSGHRANILGAAYHRVGIGVASNGAKVMVVEVFSN